MGRKVSNKLKVINKLILLNKVKVLLQYQETNLTRVSTLITRHKKLRNLFGNPWLSIFKRKRYCKSLLPTFKRNPLASNLW